MAPQAPDFRQRGVRAGSLHCLTTGGAYAANTVFSTDIVDGEVQRVDIANGAIAIAKMVDGTVTAAKIQSNAVTTGKIPIGAVTGSRLSDTAVASKLGNLIVRSNSGTGSVSAQCNTGETVLGGGGRALNSGFVPLGSSEPLPEIQTNRFVAWSVASTEPNASVTAKVICLVP